MNYQELLHDYFDGILDQDQEAALFSELHHREDLRDELRNLFLMRKAARNDADQYTPPVDSGNAIFNRLGFAPVNAPAPAQTVHRPVRNRWEGYVQALAGGLVAAILLLLFLKIGGYSIAILPSGPTAETTVAVANNSTVERESSLPGLSRGQDVDRDNEHASTVPLITDLNGSRSNSRQGKHEILSHRQNRTPSATESELGRIVNDYNSDPITEPTGRIEPMVSAAHTTPASLWMNDTVRQPAQTPYSTRVMKEPDSEIFANGSAPTPLGIEYRRVASQNMRRPPVELQEPSDVFLENSALSLTWQLNESQDIGLTIGAERFYQDFTVLAANGDTTRYQQNPLLYWGGIAFRQQFQRSTHLNPYVRLSLGGSGVGPVGRIDAGLSYQLTPVLRLFAGGEASGILYSESGARHISGKYGLTYGVSFQY